MGKMRCDTSVTVEIQLGMLEQFEVQVTRSESLFSDGCSRQWRLGCGRDGVRQQEEVTWDRTAGLQADARFKKDRWKYRVSSCLQRCLKHRTI